MIMVVVYVGAVAVLFLFVVMMLDVDFVELKQGFLNYLPIGFLIAAGLFAEMFLVGQAWLAPKQAHAIAPAVKGATNAAQLGSVLYTDYLALFQIAGMILLVAMIGAVVLTLRHRPHVRRQNVSRQVGRRRSEGVELKDVRPGQGL